MLKPENPIYDNLEINVNYENKHGIIVKNHMKSQGVIINYINSLLIIKNTLMNIL